MDPSTITEVMAFGLNEAETSAVEALLHAGGLTHPFPQIEKLRSTNFTSPLHLDGGHLGAVNQEHPFNANALEDATHGDGFVHAAVALGDHHAFVGLNTLLVALADAHAHADGVAHFELRGAEVGRLQRDRASGGVRRQRADSC